MKKIEFYLNAFFNDNFAKGLSTATCSYYKRALGYFISYLEVRKISCPKKLTAQIITDYTIKLRSSNKLSTHSINTYLRAVRRFTFFLCSQSKREPIKVKLLRGQEPQKDYFSIEEVSKIFNCQNKDDDYVLAVFLLGTGLRANSVINIKVNDLDFDTNFLYVNTAKSKRNSEIPLTKPLIQLLKEYIVLNSLSRNDYLFTNTKDTKYTRHTLWRALEKFLKRCNISKTGIHIFRHTFARLMVINGCDVFMLQKWLNHSSLEQSKKYVNLYSNDLQRSLNFNPTANLRL